MKRLHVHMAVTDLEQSTRFYSTLFGTPPSVVKPDYAKWMLDDPKVNFAISNHRAQAGIDHLGIQVDEPGELADIAARLDQAGSETVNQTATSCCYAKSDKTWVQDPSGVRWETFRTFGEATTYGEDIAELAPAKASEPVTQACCG